LADAGADEAGADDALGCIIMGLTMRCVLAVSEFRILLKKFLWKRPCGKAILVCEFVSNLQHVLHVFARMQHASYLLRGKAPVRSNV
jgi:hypothetical protein